jgi:hypothetical protein
MLFFPNWTWYCSATSLGEVNRMQELFRKVVTHVASRVTKHKVQKKKLGKNTKTGSRMRRENRKEVTVKRIS